MTDISIEGDESGVDVPNKHIVKVMNDKPCVKSAMAILKKWKNSDLIYKYRKTFNFACNSFTFYISRFSVNIIQIWSVDL